MIFVTDEQRRILNENAAPLPLIDGEGKCYMVIPVQFSAGEGGTFRATVPGIEAVAEADVPSDAAETLAVLLRTMLDNP